MQDTKKRYDCVIKIMVMIALSKMATQAASCLFFLPIHLGNIACSLAREAINDGVLKDPAKATPITQSASLQSLERSPNHQRPFERLQQ